MTRTNHFGPASPQKSTSESKYLFFALVAGSFWGSLGVFVRPLTMNGWSPIGIVFAQFAVASLILFAVLVVRSRSLLIVRLRDLPILAACGLTGMFGLNFCYYSAMTHLTLSLAAVLLNLFPAFVMLFMALFFHERITKKKTIATALLILGCAMVSGLFDGRLTMDLVGILLGVGAAFCNALYSVFSKMGSQRGYDSLTITFYGTAFAALIAALCGNVNVFPAHVASSPLSNVLIVLALGVINSLPYLLYTLSIANISASKVAVVAAAAEPITACVIGAVFFTEAPTLIVVAGVAVVIFALALFNGEDRAS